MKKDFGKSHGLNDRDTQEKKHKTGDRKGDW